MDIIATVKTQTSDCKLCMATIAGIYMPILILVAAAGIAL